MKPSIKSKLFSTIIYFLSIMVIVKIIWIAVSLFLLPNHGEEYAQKTKAKALYYRVKLSNPTATIKPVAKKIVKAPIVNSMKGIKLLALYNASDVLVVTVEKANKTTVLSKGDKIDGFTLTSAALNYAIFTKNDKEFKLDISQIKSLGKGSAITPTKKPITKKPDNKDGIIEEDGKKLINRNLLTSYTKDVDKIWKDIGIGENKIDGKLNGFKINFVKKGSDFEKLGLKRGDILTAINAEELNSYGAAMTFFKDIEDIENLTLTVQRNGKSEDLEYEIK